jgi:hypothetical protein
MSRAQLWYRVMSIVHVPVPQPAEVTGCSLRRAGVAVQASNILQPVGRNMGHGTQVDAPGASPSIHKQKKSTTPTDRRPDQCQCGATSIRPPSWFGAGLHNYESSYSLSLGVVPETHALGCSQSVSVGRCLSRPPTPKHVAQSVVYAHCRSVRTSNNPNESPATAGE